MCALNINRKFTQKMIQGCRDVVTMTSFFSFRHRLFNIFFTAAAAAYPSFRLHDLGHVVGAMTFEPKAHLSRLTPTEGSKRTTGGKVN